MRHPISGRSLWRFTKGTSTREENRSILTHLLRGCATCAAGVRSAFQPETPASAYDAVFDRLAERFQSAVGAGVLSLESPAAAAQAGLGRQ